MLVFKFFLWLLHGIIQVQLLPLLASFTPLPSAVGGSTNDSCAMIGCSGRRHSGCCTESAPQHQQATDLYPPHYPSLLLCFLLLCHLILSPPPLLSLPCPSSPTVSLHRQARKATAAAAAAAAGGLVGVLRPWLTPAVQARCRVLL